MENVCRGREAITVFPNNSPVIGEREDLPVERMLTEELIPHIDSTFRTLTDRSARAVSGFSMGGGMAFYFALRHPELFSAVTAYAGTYHHYFCYEDFRTVSAPPEKAVEFRRDLLAREAPRGRDILQLLTERAAMLRDLRIALRVGSGDVLFCDSEILHLHLNELGIPHEYRVIAGAGHFLRDIL